MSVSWPWPRLTLSACPDPRMSMCDVGRWPAGGAGGRCPLRGQQRLRAGDSGRRPRGKRGAADCSLGVMNVAEVVAAVVVGTITVLGAGIPIIGLIKLVFIPVAFGFEMSAAWRRRSEREGRLNEAKLAHAPDLLAAQVAEGWWLPGSEERRALDRRTLYDQRPFVSVIVPATTRSGGGELRKVDSRSGTEARGDLWTTARPTRRGPAVELAGCPRVTAPANQRRKGRGPQYRDRARPGHILCS